MISTANITMQFAAKPLFENVSAKFVEGGHYGLIGANGAGKSTFMKILAGTLTPTNGSVIIPPNARMASLSQDQFAYEHSTVLDTVLMGHQELWAIKEKKDALYALPEMTEDQGMEVADLEMRYAELDGYSAESRAAELLLGVDIPESCHYEKMSTIAPGLKLRVLLTQVLFSDPDIMLLDEPTNNLDINTIRWLEQVLQDRKCTLIIISHDRHFLNAVCTHTADLDYGSVALFPGGYDEYMAAALQSRELKQADVARKQAKVSELQDFVRRFSANASKSKQATSRQRQIDKIVIEKVKPSSRKFPYIKIEQEKPLHRFVCEVKDLSNGYDDNPDLFAHLNLHIEAGQKVAIIGPSGIGKTTLLKTLAGVMPPRSGFVKWSENANIGYFAQDHAEAFDDDRNLFDWMTQHGQPGDDEQVIRGALGRMLFTGDDYKKCVRVTSGGEKVRLLLAKLILQRPNILLLDEPTNHLDMESIEALNMGLEQFPGTLFFVSHDRAFVSTLATQIIEMKPDGTIEHYLGSYEDYLASQAK